MYKIQVTELRVGSGLRTTSWETPIYRIWFTSLVLLIGWFLFSYDPPEYDAGVIKTTLENVDPSSSSRIELEVEIFKLSFLNGLRTTVLQMLVLYSYITRYLHLAH
jgi:uncharacterized membrane protein SpoIIM required for sporulation